MNVNRPEIGEMNGLADGSNYHDRRHAQGEINKVYWNTKGLKVTRFRMLSDPGFPVWDVSYCHGILNGEYVDVELPFDQLPKRNWKLEVIKYAKLDGVYAKGLGIFENVSTLC